MYRYEDVDSEYGVYPCYTVQEAAQALGKSPITVKKWISDGIIPKPILKDSTYNYLQYTHKELQLIADFLQAYSTDRVYLTKAEASELEALRQQIEGYRMSNI